MARAAIGPKQINISPLEVASGSAGARLLPGTLTTDSTIAVIAGACYRVSALFGDLKLGVGAVYGGTVGGTYTGTVNGTAVLFVFPPNTIGDIIIPPGVTALHFGSALGSSEGWFTLMADANSGV